MAKAAWEVGYGMFTGKVDQLRIGEWYNWTAQEGRKCKLVSIDQVFGKDASVTVLYRGNLYCAGSDQLYLYALV